MIYPAELEQRLGFDQIRQRLMHYCQGPLGAEQVSEMKFLTEFEPVVALLNETHEFRLIMESGKEFPSTHHEHPGEHLQRAAWEGAYLEEESFVSLISSFKTVEHCKLFFSVNSELYPRLATAARQVPDLKHLIASLESKFDEQGRIRDNATPELQKIRKQIREEETKVKRLTDQLFRHAVAQGWVPEGISYTIREGRLVIPVLAEHKRRIKGFIVDESATGQTVYIEPAEVLEANNELRDLWLADRREVIKLLKQLTAILRGHLPEVHPAFYFLAKIDFTKAKATYALELEAELPRIVPKPDLNWLHARHPLLYASQKGKRTIVPLTIDLTEECPFLLISGPNAGGKSVCLKTVGLMQYMVQCGLLPPLHEKSTVGIFKNLFLDIGDQQSIENDLSTYSSHLKNLAFFLAHADQHSLVLMDELGSGTDPNFGGGIAEAILAGLIERRTWGVATTHYYNLKVFAGNHRGIRNGAMLFDTKKLEPLFTLEIGKPGSSFALEIARKTGLPEATIKVAEKIIGSELTGLESLMKATADEKQQVARLRIGLTDREKQLKQTQTQYENLLNELESKKKVIVNQAKEEAARLLKEANREIEKTIRHIRENKAEKKETKKVRLGLQSMKEKVEPAQKNNPAADEQRIEVGSKVRLSGQEVTGTVLSIKENNAVVQFGDWRSTVNLKQLVLSHLAEPDTPTRTTPSAGMSVLLQQSSFQPILDIRGRRAEEVVPLLEKFVDQAVLLSHAQLKIIHGKGEGVLRKIVRDYLKKVKPVVSVSDEHADRGGDGITLVVLK
jgi:DNA mismatch repair protein MutS2